MIFSKTSFQAHLKCFFAPGTFYSSSQLFSRLVVICIKQRNIVWSRRIRQKRSSNLNRFIRFINYCASFLRICQAFTTVFFFLLLNFFWFAFENYSFLLMTFCRSPLFYPISFPPQHLSHRIFKVIDKKCYNQPIAYH